MEITLTFTMAEAIEVMAALDTTADGLAAHPGIAKRNSDLSDRIAYDVAMQVATSGDGFSAIIGAVDEVLDTLNPAADNVYPLHHD
jgi:hypothetical protein